MIIEKYSFGIGDRFAQQGIYQLDALAEANKLGYEFVPVWNKSKREHKTIGSEPLQTKLEAENAVKDLQWNGNFYIDADHINLSNVDEFVDCCNFFTLDVADYIGEKARQSDIDDFVKKCSGVEGSFSIPGIIQPFNIAESDIYDIANNFLYAIKEAGKIYRHIESKKGKGNFITEVSMDEVENPQTPVEMLFILKMISLENIPAQTIAPKFTGRFNKGVDYEGDLLQFEKEFEEDILVIDYAVKEFKLENNLKFSIHSGSDKFSIYPVIGKLIKKYNKGIHIKTAGTTWLEEVIGLAEAGNDALDLAKQIYAKAYEKRDELCKPYANVIDIKEKNLPTIDEVKSWDSKKFADSLRHIPGNKNYNPDFRQLIHVGYKVAASFGQKYVDVINKYSEIVGEQVKTNILERHIRRLW